MKSISVIVRLKLINCVCNLYLTFATYFPACSYLAFFIIKR